MAIPRSFSVSFPLAEEDHISAVSGSPYFVHKSPEAFRMLCTSPHLKCFSAPMDYLRWNDQIASKFFNPEAAGRRVYLHVTRELIAEIGRDEGIAVPDFVRSVKGGPPWCSGVPLCLRAKEAFVGWRKVPSKLLFPPYIGFLGLFVLAAGLGEDGEFSMQAYYPRLRKLLGDEESTRPYPHFEEMRELWADLERWSQGDKHGEIGVFEYPATGRFVNVGVPISQTILTEQERRDLPADSNSLILPPSI